MAATNRTTTAMVRKAVKDLNKSDLDPIERIRLNLLARGSAGIIGLGRLFRIIDDDGSNSLSYAEMKKGLQG